MNRLRTPLLPVAVGCAIALGACGGDEAKTPAKEAAPGSAEAFKQCVQAAREIRSRSKRERALQSCEDVAAVVPDVEAISAIAVTQCIAIARQALTKPEELKRAEANCRKRK
jgi:hypothetical protein